MFETILYVFTFLGLMGLFFISLGQKFPKKWMIYAPFVLFSTGILGAFFFNDANLSTWVSVICAMTLGGYIAWQRPGLFSIKVLKSGISLALISISLVILEMPSHYLLPSAGHLTIFEKLLFVLLTVSSTFSFLAHTMRTQMTLTLPLTSLIVKGLNLLILSISLLFLATESPTGLILISGLTLAWTLAIRLFFTQTPTNLQLFDRFAGYVFGLQFVFLGLLLNYIPLFLVAGVITVQNLPTLPELKKIKDTFLWPKK